MNNTVDFDFQAPDYVGVLRQRAARLHRIRTGAVDLSKLKLFYKNNPAQFIDDWGMTVDPRNVELDRPALVPFRLFAKQREWVDFVVERWRAQRPGIVEKSRDMGISWLAVSLSCTLCLFNDGMGIGFGSRKEEYVDRLGDPKSLFFKARSFMSKLPIEFRGGWSEKKHAPHMRLHFPDSGSTMTGEAGDNIGRGDRTGIYFVDESAHLAHPDLVDAALSQTTNCRIDMSSVNGMANSFARRRHGGKIKVFTFHWRDDPRKDDAWYERQKEDLDPVVVAQEIDIDYQASAEGVLIPSAWAQACVDADKKLGMSAQGRKRAALDVGDTGDPSAWVGGRGPLIDRIEEWQDGAEGDIFQTTLKAFGFCDDYGTRELRYDGDGLGAGVRGDARIINAQRTGYKIAVETFRGSGAVLRPTQEDVQGIANEDMFANYKAQAWWALRTRCYKTWRAVRLHGRGEPVPYKPEELMFIRGGLKHTAKLLLELAQPTYSSQPSGKRVVDKKPEGARSPNLADGAMMYYAETQGGVVVTDEMLAASQALGHKIAMGVNPLAGRGQIGHFGVASLGAGGGRR